MSNPKFDWKSFLTRRERGQSLTEVAISASVLLLIVAGILDLGRLYFVYVALEDAVGEAALYLAAVNPYCRFETDVPPSPPGGSCADPNNAEYRARNAGGGQLTWDTANITLTQWGTQVGEPVEVTITYQFELITPIIPRTVGVNPLTLTTSARQIVVNEPSVVP